MKILTPLLCTGLALGTLSCRPEVAPAYDVNAMRTCFLQGRTDSLSLAHSLADRWAWVREQCDTSQVAGSSALLSSLQVEFGTNGSLAVYLPAQAPIELKWQLKKVSDLEGDGYRIDTSPRIREMAGVIYLCGDQAMFGTDGPDKCNDYYRRVR